MTKNAFDSKLVGLIAHSSPGAGEARAIADELFRRDHQRVRLLAALSFFLWLLFAAGMFLLVFGLRDFVQSVRIGPELANGAGAATQEQLKFWSTDLIHHSMPFVLGSVVALPLAAISMLMVVFSSRQATLKRINLSLLQLSAQLTQERAGTSSEPAQAVATAITPVNYTLSKRSSAGRFFFNVIVGLLVAAAALITFAFITNPWHGYPRTLPFAAIRWQGETPQVEVEGTWYQLLSVNDVPVEQIIAFSKSMGATTWQKHFDEDLVELLTLMGHTPGVTATLQVEDLNSAKTEILKDVPMTEANRLAIRRAD